MEEPPPRRNPYTHIFRPVVPLQAMLGLGPIGTLKGVQKSEDKKPAKKMSSLDFDLGLSDDDDDDTRSVPPAC